MSVPRVTYLSAESCYAANVRAKTIHFLLAGQITLWAGLLVSFILSPGIARDNEGISTFGIYAKTILPYGLGFLACGYFTLAAAHAVEYRDHKTAFFVRALLLLVFLLLGVLLTPYSVNSLFSWSHTIIAAALFMCELMLAVWFMYLHSDALNWLLFALQFTGSLLAAFSLLHLLNYMLAGQLMAQLAFWVLLDRTVPYALSN